MVVRIVVVSKGRISSCTDGLGELIVDWQTRSIWWNQRGSETMLHD